MSADPVTKPGLRERKKQEKLDRIKRAARALFSKRGFQATTIRDIAARAGVATGTVFLYARDKQDILYLLFSEAVTEVQDEAFDALAARTAPPLPLLDQIVHVFGRFFAFYDRDRALSRQFVKELLFTGEPQGTRHFALTFAFLERIGQLVAAAQARGEIRKDVVPQQAAMLFFGTYFLVLVGFLDPSGVMALDVESALAQLQAGLTVQIEGLRPQRSRRPTKTAAKPSATQAAPRAATRRSAPKKAKKKGC